MTKPAEVPTPPASVCDPAISFSLAADPSVSERASGALGRMGSLDLQGRWCVCSPVSVPHVLV